MSKKAENLNWKRKSALEIIKEWKKELENQHSNGNLINDKELKQVKQSKSDENQ